MGATLQDGILQLPILEMCYSVRFITKRRAPALVGEIDDCVRATFRDVATRTRGKIVELETALGHVHLLLDLSDGQRLPIVMHDLKGASGRKSSSSPPTSKWT